MATFIAVYEHGTLRPLAPIDLAEGERVEVTVERSRPQATFEEIAALARAVYEGLSEEEIDEIEKEFHRPMSMFGDREPLRFSD